MSGTSADGVDAALVRIGTSAREISLLGFVSMPFSQILYKRIHEFSQAPVSTRDILSLDVEIGERFAEAAQAVLQEAGYQAQCMLSYKELSPFDISLRLNEIPMGAIDMEFPIERYRSFTPRIVS